MSKNAEYLKRKAQHQQERRKVRMQTDPAFRHRIRLKERRYRKRRMVNDPQYRERIYRANVLRKYGLSSAAYTVLSEGQQHCCAICGKPPQRKFLEVDHCHRTNYVRGLLCRRCNLGLKEFDDNIERLLKAVEYLRRTSF